MPGETRGASRRQSQLLDLTRGKGPDTTTPAPARRLPVQKQHTRCDLRKHPHTCSIALLLQELVW